MAGRLTKIYRTVRRVEASAGLESALAAALEAGRRAWPAIALSDEELVRHLARHAAPEELAGCNAPDLYLATACAAGSSPAIAALEARVGPALDRALARIGGADEVRPLLRARLFTREDGGEPRIAGYSGQGPIERFIRVAAVRIAIDLQRADRRRTTLEEPEVARLAGADPELAFIKARYRDAFEEALRGALADLDSEGRNLLRLHYLDGLTIDQLAPVVGGHRSTAARKVARCRAALLAATRERLGERLHLAPGELDSMVRLLRSHIHVSLSRILRES
jgi:RNA polymerase sigma-70 factor (ECF subfamily)